MSEAALVQRLERSAAALGAIKLANAGIVILWGFALTFVFARALDIAEFQNFVLLIALANFTFSAEFGFTNILYDRVRRRRLRAAWGFSFAEVAMLAAAVMGVIALAAVALALCFAGGVIETRLPGLMLAFFILSCLNIAVLLAKRVLAALDHNLMFEMADIARRLACLILLLAILGGLDAGLSVALQLAVTAAALFHWARLIQRRLGVRARHWLALPKGLALVRARYPAAMRASVVQTVAEVSAYNAPFLLIAALSNDPRPLLLYDFAYKLMRALGTGARAVVEAFLPRMTSAAHQAQGPRLVRLFFACIGASGLLALILIAALGLAGPWIVRALYDGKAVIAPADMAMIAIILLALPVAQLSAQMHGALGRFRTLVRASLPLLAIAVGAPVLGWACGGKDFGEAFLALWTIGYIGIAALHAALLHALSRQAAVGRV